MRSPMPRLFPRSAAPKPPQRSASGSRAVAALDERPVAHDGGRVDELVACSTYVVRRVPGTHRHHPHAGGVEPVDQRQGRGQVTSDDDLVHRGVRIAQDLKKASGPKLKDFREHLAASPPAALGELAAEVEEFAAGFPTIGFEKGTMRYGDAK